MLNGVLPVFGFEWTDFLRGDLIWLVIVVGLGLLTLLKRGLEMLLGAGRASAPPPGRRPGEAPAKRPEAPEQPTVFEEMKRYFEILEGKTAAKPTPPPPPTASAPSPPLPEGLAPARPSVQTPTEVDLDAAFHLPHGGRKVEAVADQVMTTPGSLARGLRAEFRALDSDIAISHEELARGSSAFQRRRHGLPMVRLTRARPDLRSAVLWSEILGRARHRDPV